MLYHYLSLWVFNPVYSRLEWMHWTADKAPVIWSLTCIIVLCSWERQLFFTVHVSTRYRVLNQMITLWKWPCHGLTFHPVGNRNHMPCCFIWGEQVILVLIGLCKTRKMIKSLPYLALLLVRCSSVVTSILKPSANSSLFTIWYYKLSET